MYALAETPTRQVGDSRLGASYTRREAERWLASPTRRAPEPLTIRKVREVVAGAIEMCDLRELAALSEAVGVVSRGGFRSLASMDAAASRLQGKPGRETTATRIGRARRYCAEHGILLERSASTTVGRRRADDSPTTRSTRHGDHHHGGRSQARQQTRRGERSEQ